MTRGSIHTEYTSAGLPQLTACSMGQGKKQPEAQEEGMLENLWTLSHY